MKSKIIALIGLFLMIVIITSCTKSNDWKRYSLNGKVKSYYEKYYKAEYKFGEWTNGEICYSNHNKVSFTNDGVYYGVEFFDFEGELDCKTISKSDGHLKVESLYDNEGKLMNKTTFNMTSSDAAEIIEYDKNGKLVLKGTSYFDNSLFVRGDYVNYENGKQVGKQKTIITRDSDGNIQTYQIIDEKGKVLDYRRYEYLKYDKKHNWVERISYNSKESKNPDEYVIRDIVYY